MNNFLLKLQHQKEKHTAALKLLKSSFQDAHTDGRFAEKHRFFGLKFVQIR